MARVPLAGTDCRFGPDRAPYLDENTISQAAKGTSIES